MKISDVKENAIQMVQQYQKSEKVKHNSQQINGSPAPEERVDLSVRSKDIQKIRKAIDELPDIREERVQELKNQIEKGIYRISGEKIAEKMAGEALLDILI